MKCECKCQCNAPVDNEVIELLKQMRDAESLKEGPIPALKEIRKMIGNHESLYIEREEFEALEEDLEFKIGEIDSKIKAIFCILENRMILQELKERAKELNIEV